MEFSESYTTYHSKQRIPKGTSTKPGRDLSGNVERQQIFATKKNLCRSLLPQSVQLRKWFFRKNKDESHSSPPEAGG